MRHGLLLCESSLGLPLHCHTGACWQTWHVPIIHSTQGARLPAQSTASEQASPCHPFLLKDLCREQGAPYKCSEGRETWEKGAQAGVGMTQRRQ